MRAITSLLLAITLSIFTGSVAPEFAQSRTKAKPEKREAADRKVRPYLNFTPKGATALRDKMKGEPFASRYTRLLEVARNYAGRPVSDARVRGGNRARNAQGMISLLSLAYVLSGRDEFGNRAKAEVFSILAQDAWHEDRGWNRGADLETAECSQACGLFYDWCHPLLNDAERQTFRERALELGLKPYLASIETHRPKNVDMWVDNPVTNWCGVCHGGGGLLGLALYDELPEARKAADYAWTHLCTFLDKVILQDGGGHEGVMYWRYGVSMAFAFVTAYEHTMGTDLPLDVSERMAGYWDVYLWGPDKAYANFNNMGEDTFKGLRGEDQRQWEGGPSGPLCALFEARTTGGDPLLLWGADHGGGGAFTDGLSVHWFLWRRDTPPAAAAKPKLQPNVLFRGAGHAVLSSEKLWLAFNGGWTSNKSHHNFDLGSFVLVYDGERFVHDPGYGHKDVKQHSCVVIDGANTKEAGQASITCFAGGKSYHWLQCDLSEPWEQRAKSVRRTLVTVEGRYVVILDEVETKGSTDIEWRLATRHTPKLTDSGAILEAERGCLHVIAANEGKVSAGREQIHFVGIRPQAASAKALFVTVLYPDKKGSAAPACSWKVKGTTGTLAVGPDKLEFKESSAGWTLAKVGSEKVDRPQEPVDRVLQRVK